MEMDKDQIPVSDNGFIISVTKFHNSRCLYIIIARKKIITNKKRTFIFKFH